MMRLRVGLVLLLPDGLLLPPPLPKMSELAPPGGARTRDEVWYEPLEDWNEPGRGKPGKR